MTSWMSINRLGTAKMWIICYVYWAYMAVSFNYICIVITLNDLILSLIVKLVVLLFVM